MNALGIRKTFPEALLWVPRSHGWHAHSPLKVLLCPGQRSGSPKSVIMENGPSSQSLPGLLSASKLQVMERRWAWVVRPHRPPQLWVRSPPLCGTALLSLTSPTPNIAPLLRLSEYQTQERPLQATSTVYPATNPSFYPKAQKVKTVYSFEYGQKNTKKQNLNKLSNHASLKCWSAQRSLSPLD